ncbi:hypothetical protein GXM_02263 [Nostoc sphaeroides CCNUC1]|uniref:Uncharacterized protein n=1 Tax=Nostoc sphaeroides CCNUC1 TaxID=2653204 RepID=A0A5P8VWK3_9NOSO|nr:hypothetical protein GXM_02263 [Nostoc sphaeroides CCNUC1]
MPIPHNTARLRNFLVEASCSIAGGEMEAGVEFLPPLPQELPLPPLLIRAVLPPHKIV